MHFKQLKWFHVAGLVLAVELVVGGGYWWRSWGGEQEKVSGDGVEIVDEMKVADGEVIDTSDWKTYRNEEYGFSFRYPADKNLMEKYVLGPELSITSPDSSEESVQIFIRNISEFDKSKWLSLFGKKKGEKSFHYEDMGNYQVIVEEDVLTMGPIIDSYMIFLKKITLEMGILRSEKNRGLIEKIITSITTF